MKNGFTILVSGASGIVGYGILKCLRAGGLPLELIGTTIYTDSAAEAFCDIFELAPRTDAPDYLRWLTSCIARRHVDMIIPSIEADMLFWNLHREELREAGTFPLLNRLPRQVAVLQAARSGGPAICDPHRNFRELRGNFRPLRRAVHLEAPARLRLSGDTPYPRRGGVRKILQRRRGGFHDAAAGDRQRGRGIHRFRVFR